MAGQVPLLQVDAKVAEVFAESLEGAWSTPDVAVALGAALQAVRTLIAKNKYTVKDVAFVMDIDDTVVFERAQGEWDDGEIRPHPLGVAGMRLLRTRMRDLFNDLKALGKVYFVTAREAPTNRQDAAWTTNELKRHKIRGWECLYFCPREMRTSWASIAAFKRNARRHVERTSGRVILLSVGDKWSDILAHSLTKEQDQWDAGKQKFVLARISQPEQRSVLALKLPCRASRRAQREARRQQQAAAAAAAAAAAST